MRKMSVFALVAMLAALVVAASPGSALAKGVKKMGAPLRVHGPIVRISADGSVLTVRDQNRGNTEQEVHLTADTKFTQVGGKGKKEATIDKGDLKEGDDVICLLKAGEKEMVATRVSKRLPK